jgi:hypothetical protein
MKNGGVRGMMILGRRAAFPPIRINRWSADDLDPRMRPVDRCSADPNDPRLLR